MRAQAGSSPPPSPGTNEQESEWLLCLVASQAGRRHEPIQVVLRLRLALRQADGGHHGA